MSIIQNYLWFTRYVIPFYGTVYIFFRSCWKYYIFYILCNYNYTLVCSWYPGNMLDYHTCIILYFIGIVTHSCIHLYIHAFLHSCLGLNNSQWSHMLLLVLFSTVHYLGFQLGCNSFNPIPNPFWSKNLKI